MQRVDGSLQVSVAPINPVRLAPRSKVKNSLPFKGTDLPLHDSWRSTIRRLTNSCIICEGRTSSSSSLYPLNFGEIRSRERSLRYFSGLRNSTSPEAISFTGLTTLKAGISRLRSRSFAWGTTFSFTGMTGTAADDRHRSYPSLSL